MLNITCTTYSTLSLRQAHCDSTWDPGIEDIHHVHRNKQTLLWSSSSTSSSSAYLMSVQPAPAEKRRTRTRTCAQAHNTKRNMTRRSMTQRDVTRRDATQRNATHARKLSPNASVRWALRVDDSHTGIWHSRNTTVGTGTASGRDLQIRPPYANLRAQRMDQPRLDHGYDCHSYSRGCSCCEHRFVNHNRPAVVHPITLQLGGRHDQGIPCHVRLVQCSLCWEAYLAKQKGRPKQDCRKRDRVCAVR